VDRTHLHRQAGSLCPSLQPGVAPVVGIQYLGKGLRRREIRGQQGKSDLAEKMKIRFSDDNGRTWTPLAPLETGSDSLRQGQNYREDLSFAVISTRLAPNHRDDFSEDLPG